MTGAPYSIGSDHWPGLSKLIEEIGEVDAELAEVALHRALGRVQQVCGKLLGTGGAVEHWDGSNLKERLEDELGDLRAAIRFVAAQCGLNSERMRAREYAKVELFEAWQAEGRALGEPRKANGETA